MRTTSKGSQRSNTSANANSESHGTEPKHSREPGSPSEADEQPEVQPNDPKEQNTFTDLSESLQPLSCLYATEKKGIKVNWAKFIRDLQDGGFGRVRFGDNLRSDLARVRDNIVRSASNECAKRHIMRRLRAMPDEDLPEEYSTQDAAGMLIRGGRAYYSSSTLENLPLLQKKFQRDTAEKGFLYFENCFWEVTADKITPRPYDELNGLVWKDQVNEHPCKDPAELGQSAGDFKKFVWKISGENEKRYETLVGAIGYLLHGYKDPTCAKAVILMDEEVSEVASGRTGKSLIAKSIGHVVPAKRIDARNFSFQSRFKFQGVRPRHQVVDFNDASRKFDFEKLFSILTDSMPVERKNRDAETIPFSESPKFLLSTNYVIEGSGASFEDRTHQVELHPAYSANHRPIDDFGRRFFEGWDKEEWSRFYRFMAYCLKQYLRHGLRSYEHVNLKEKKLRQETSPDFAEWVVDLEPKWYKKSALCRSFQETHEGDYENLTQNMFTRWLNRYGRIYTGDALPTKKSGADRHIKLTEELQNWAG